MPFEQTTLYKRPTQNYDLWGLKILYTQFGKFYGCTPRLT